MAIRLRVIDGNLIAICAAVSVEKEGDIYLDDNAHHALGVKFARNYRSMYGYDIPTWDENKPLVECEENDNPARTSWNREYGDDAIP